MDLAAAPKNPARQHLTARTPVRHAVQTPRQLARPLAVIIFFIKNAIATIRENPVKK